MNPFEMVVLIVAIVMVASIFKAKLSSRQAAAPADDVESHRLRDEVRQLKDRIAVLERITLEKENDLERQIEQLRDR